MTKYFNEHYNCNTIDGVRINFDFGWGLIRSSNTQPVIVCRMEAINEELLLKYKDMVLDKLLSLGVEINENL